MTITLATGNLAYFDSFAGLVPCWIVSIDGPKGTPSTAQTVTVKFTAKRGPYRKGEIYQTSGLHVCPRGAARLGKHCTSCTGGRMNPTITQQDISRLLGREPRRGEGTWLRAAIQKARGGQ